MPRRRHLPGMRPRGDELLGERGAGAEHGLEAHGADDVGGERQAQRVVVAKGSDAGHQLRPVEERQALLRAELEGRQPGMLEGVGARAGTGTVDRCLSLADEDERQVGERRQVARRAEAAARGDDGMDGLVEHADEELGDGHADARQPDGERVGAQQEHRAHDLVGQRVADAGRVRPNEVALQLGRLVRLDPHVGEVAEARRDAVDGRPLVDEPLDDGPRLAHASRGIRVERHRSSAACHLDDVVDREGPDR